MEKESTDISIFGDKSDNFYGVPVPKSKDVLRDSIVNTYKKADVELVKKTNEEAARITDKLGIADRVEVMKQDDAFNSFKDQKHDFAKKGTD